MINRMVWRMSANKGFQSWPHTGTIWEALKTLAAWPGWEGFGVRMEACTCLAESLCCLPETITTLLTGYTPIQKKKERKKTKTLAAWILPLGLMISLV